MEPELVAEWGSGEPLEVAKASAWYRVTNGVKGHCHIDAARKSGVGYSQGMKSNTPKTCYWRQRKQGSYAAYRIGDEVYATLIF